MRKLIMILFFLTFGLLIMAEGQSKKPQKEDTVKKKTVVVTKDKNGKETIEKEKEVNRKREHRKNINEPEKK